MTPPPKYNQFFKTFKSCFYSESGLSTKIFNKYYGKGRIKRTKSYLSFTLEKTYKGYLYYNNNIQTDEEALTYWLRRHARTYLKALKTLQAKSVLTLAQMKTAGWNDTEALSIISAHDYYGIKRKYLGAHRPVVYYVCTEKKLTDWISNELPKILYGSKSDFIKQALAFETVCMNILRKKLNKTTKIEKQVYRTGKYDKQTYKFDLIAWKKLNFLGKKIPIIVECKSFFFSNKAYPMAVYFRHKLQECFPQGGYIGVIMTKGAGPKDVFDKIGSLGLWIIDVTPELKKIKH